MTRPKVPDDKRQRTAQACITCKRRKQKKEDREPRNNRHALSGIPRHSSAQDIDAHDSTATSGQEEEAEVYTETRMLQAPDGRPIYLGDSATLSGIQLLRAIVENVYGPCDFTTDPSRHKIMEHKVDLAAGDELPGVLPSLEASSALIEAFFTNTHGLLDLFNRADFERAAVASLNEPFIAKPKLLCLMYLTLAVGLVLATPRPTKEQEMVRRLRESEFDVAENFFRSTRRLADPMTIQENADFWSVQILCLMSVYMLSISRRNAAHSYLAVRRNVWRSLFVMDRFLAAALGRPTMIAENHCSLDALEPPNGSGPIIPSIASSLSVAVEIAKVMGHILQKIYSRRRVSVALGQQFAEDCKRVEKLLRDDLNPQRAMDPLTPQDEAVSILHLSLFHYHAVILYTRPFFLFLLKKDQVDGMPPGRFHTRIQRFSKACIKYSALTIRLVYGAFEAKYLPRRNPFFTHFLFAASLIILGNEFAGLHPNAEYQTQISRVLAVTTYCAETDPQANRLMFILKSFRDVIIQRRAQLDPDQDGSLLRPLSPVETHSTVRSMSSVTGRNPSDAVFSDISQPRTSVSTAGSAVFTVNSRIGETFQEAVPMVPEAGFPVGYINDASPGSTNSFSRPTTDATSAKRASDINTPVGDEEVYLGNLWQGPHGDAGAMPLFQSPAGAPAKLDRLGMGSFGIYSVFIHGTKPAVQEEAVGGAGIPGSLQLLLNPDVPR
ncbi:uncharacterized protein DNG_03875 [Cephalotrichum gorgonifer]|uniref:Xylanolytic transcriptional activator regulatory domain-containing protein n=1 Tax=Cephalotrichum gorgonifer TaxID=2041049 RepID=A0AAE8MW16_9PEZI|nr:uncharacterized protein DNG_03875 [Cephalotrichum gorgonifer]